MNVKKRKKRKKRIAIIGAGAGGLYTAMRLSESDDFKKGFLKIDIYEATHRIGGRVFTLPLNKFPFTADIGAMRYIGDRQLIISSLIKYLELKSETHKVKTLSIFTRDKFFLPFGDEILEKSDLTQEPTSQNTYNLRKEEKLIPPALMVIYAIAKAISKLHIHDEVNRQDAICISVTDKISKLKRIFEKEKKDDKTYIKNICEYVMEKFTLEFFTVQEWDLIRNFAQYEEDFLYQTCLFEILHKELSFESVLLAQESLGYSSIFGSANAAEHIPWFIADFSSTNYSAVVGGMSILMDTLKERIKKLGISIHTDFKLLSVEGNKNYKLKFDQKHKSRRCDKLIFSVSKGALERIHFDTRLKISKELESICKSKKLSDVIQCVSGLPLMKAFLFFDTNWFWTTLQPSQQKQLLSTNNIKDSDVEWLGQFLDGYKILSDLPIKQIYFHEIREGKIWTSGRINPTLNPYVKSMIMAYGDSKYSELWSSISRLGINHENQDRPVIQDKFKVAYFTNEKVKDEILLDIEASQALKDVLMRNIREVLREVIPANNLNDINPVAVFMQDWNRSPYFGGWHAWNVNCKPWRIRREIDRPFENQNIFICGEVFSTDQGWIEGAFRTTEKMLNDHFGYKQQPKWIDYSLIKNTIWSMDEQKDKWTAYLNG